MDLGHFIDAVYVINLPQSTKRLKRFQENYKNFNHPNLIRFTAIDGKDVKVNNWSGNLGSLGCRQSHINLLQDAKQKGHTHFIVFEDDVFIPKKFRKNLSSFLEEVNPDWDMIYLYAENHTIKPDLLSNNIMKLNNTLGTVGIIYNQKCLNIVLNKIENDLRWIDSSIADLHAKLNVYAATKSIVNHYDGFSIIEQKNMRYKDNFVNFFIQKMKNLFYKIYKQND
ncbi:Glycosyltransferase family 25 (LPS biosynthesis protein) [compost metagenome]